MHKREGRLSVALAAAALPGVGGLGVFADNALDRLLATGADVRLYSPGRADDAGTTQKVQWTARPTLIGPVRRRFSHLRFLDGRVTHVEDRATSRWLARIVPSSTDVLYCFSQIALEVMAALPGRTARVVDHPNGSPAHLRDVTTRELSALGVPVNVFHPTGGMVRRLRREFLSADVVRVSSEWSRRSLSEWGVASERIRFVPQFVDTDRFSPLASGRDTDPRLGICFVGRLVPSKGFVRLLRAARRLGRDRVHVRLVGATGDPLNRWLLARERHGIDLVAAPGDPRTAYHRADVVVLPSLHDGFGLVVAEAMASGTPVIVTDACGSAEWVTPEVDGWVIPAGDDEALADALSHAVEVKRRGSLPGMGRAARETALRCSEQARRIDLLDALFRPLDAVPAWSG